MCCFAGPLACAAAAHAVRRSLIVNHNPFAAKMLWLEKLTFGGAALLALEHLWHGEILLQAPFLTSGPAEIVREIVVTGGMMSAALLAVWGAMLLVCRRHERKTAAVPEEA